nr:retrovirus-related Pol polyprotein from transposon TNT 1-94 [Tanacetum cinerariifolium]
MTGNLKLLINFVWKFMGTVRFENDHVAAILGFGDLQWGNILITRVYFVEGLGYNLFSVGQFCDSDLEVAFRRNAYFVRNLEGVDLLKGDRSTNLYTINLHEMASASPICLMAHASSTKSWLWHQRLSHLNFDTINDLARNDLISCLPKSKDEAPEVIKTFFKRIIVLLQSPVIIIRTDNGTEFKNQALKDFFDSVGISHQMSSIQTPQENGVVERQNWTLVEAARTMLIFSHAPLFLWTEAIATACFTQNRSIIHRHFNKTPYELINDRKPDISFLHVFGALCYPKNDRKDIRNLGAKKIIETMNVSFDELSAMAFEQRSLKPGLQSMTSGQISSGLDLTYASSTITTQQPSEVRSDGDMCMYALTVSTMEPKNIKKAMTNPAWIDSMQEELLQFKRLDVWVLVPASDNISPLTLKWLFKNKYDEEQTVIRNKSRLVVRGYHQEEGSISKNPSLWLLGWKL